MNYAENILRRRDDGVAVIAAGEDGLVRSYTFRELHTLVQEMAAALRANGLQVGDRVAGMIRSRPCILEILTWHHSSTAIVTNSINAVVIALAVASIGGVFSSTAPDMGTQVFSSAWFYRWNGK